MSNYAKVAEFHRAYSMPIGDSPNILEDRVTLRKDLIAEEWDELQEAIDNRDMAAIAKELCDVLYVVYGLAVEFGIDADACFEAVHASNMSKLGEDGKPIYREDGKVLKGPNYFQADMDAVLYGAGQRPNSVAR